MDSTDQEKLSDASFNELNELNVPTMSFNPLFMSKNIFICNILRKNNVSLKLNYLKQKANQSTNE